MKVGDGYGQLLLDALEQGGDMLEIVERDDGFIMASRYGPQAYLAPFRKWPPRQRKAMRLARGRVLDVGAGGGRVALHLQEKGLDVVAIDASPGAVEVCRRRGVHDARLLRIEDVDESLGSFDTIVMYGNNLGLLASRTKGRRILRRLQAITTERGRIIGECLDPYGPPDSPPPPEHLAYHERNRQRGRMSGQIRIRIRYRDVATPWFDYLFVSRAELEDIVAGTGWHVARTFEGEAGLYVAVLEKELTSGKSSSSRRRTSDG